MATPFTRNVHPKPSYKDGLYIPIYMILTMSCLPIIAALLARGIVDGQLAALLVNAISLMLVAFQWKIISNNNIKNTPTTNYCLIFLVIFLSWGIFSNSVSSIGPRYGNIGDMWRQYIMATLPAVYLLLFARVTPQYSSRNLLLCFDSFAIIIAILFASSRLGLFSASTDVMVSGGIRREFGIVGDAIAWPVAFLSVMYFSRKNWLAAGLFLSFLLLTASRAPFLITALCIVAMLAVRQVRGIRDYVGRIAILIAMAAAASIAQDRVMPVLQRISGANLLESDRIVTTAFTLKVFQQSPIWGSGYNSQQFFFPQFFGNSSYSVGKVFKTPMSTPIQMLADFGVIGFALFALMAYFIIAASVRIFFRTTPLGLVGGELDLFRTVQAIAVWNVAFLLLNHSAAYLLPLSIQGMMFFAFAGCVLGYSARARANSSSATRT